LPWSPKKSSSASPRGTPLKQRTLNQVVGLLEPIGKPENLEGFLYAQSWLTQRSAEVSLSLQE
jgi:hypothetical protein